MKNYFETKSQPITMFMVLKAYEVVRSNGGSGGVDAMDWVELDANLEKHLYKLWNRMSSGSYFPMPVKEVEIPKKSGGKRKLGIPTLLDRIAQQVVKAYLEPILDPLFHENSYGYRRERNAHQAIETAQKRCMEHDWVLDLDIWKFYDTIDHELMLTALKHYCRDKWVLLYVERWLKAGCITKEGKYLDRLTGTPQGGVISPLLSNLYLHIAFDAWMQKYHPDKPFERFADDAVVHCKTEKQCRYMKWQIEKRMQECKLMLHPEKTKIINLRGKSETKYARSFDFLGYTIRPVWTWVKKTNHFWLVVMPIMSKKSQISVFDKLRKLKIHKIRKPITEVASRLRSLLQGVINYYCKFNAVYTRYFWYSINQKLIKWVRWEKDLGLKKAIKWLKRVWKSNPRLFPHWELVHP